jgi:hypothetical protein
MTRLMHDGMAFFYWSPSHVYMVTDYTTPGMIGGATGVKGR